MWKTHSYLKLSLRLWAVTILIAVLATHSHAQLIAPALMVEGPNGHEFVYAVRYYADGKPTSTTVSREQLPFSREKRFNFELESGADGVQVDVAVAGHSAWYFALADGSDQGSSQSVSEPTVLNLKLGQVPADDKLPDLNAFPTEEDKVVIAQFLAAVEHADSKSMVSELPLSNIDWPVLDAYLEKLNELLGRIQYPDTSTDASDWLTWEGSLGARVYSGVVHFERGDCHFRFMVVDGKVVDVEPTSPEMPANWLVEPPNCDAYTIQSQAMLSALFAGNATDAQLHFSPRFQEEASVEDVSRLSNQLREKFGTEILRTGQVMIEMVDDGPTHKLLKVTTQLYMNSGRECLGTVAFEMESGRNVISRAHLKSFYVTETLPSALPSKARVLTDMLLVLSGASVDEIAAVWFENFAPNVKRFISLDELRTFIARIVDRSVRPNGNVSLDLWRYTEGNIATSSGSVLCTTGQDVTFTFHWLGDQIYGVTVRSQWLAESTLGLNNSGSAAPTASKLIGDATQRAETFWRALLTGQAEQAHAQLSGAFAEKLTIDQLRESATRELGSVEDSPALTTVALESTHLAADDARVAPVAIGVHQLATFADGTYLPLYAEFAVVDGLAQTLDAQAQDGDVQDVARITENVEDQIHTAALTPILELRKFSSDVAANYPLADRNLAQQFADSFIEQSPAKLISMLQGSARMAADPRLLKLFMQTVATASGEPMHLSKRIGCVREIRDGQQRQIVEALLAGPTDAVPFRAVFELNELTTFHFEHPQLVSYAHALKDTELLHDRIKEFVLAWHDEKHLASDGERLAPFLDLDLRKPAAFQVLGNLQRKCQLDFGGFQAVEILSSTPTPDSNDLQYHVLLRFERGEKELLITLTVGAADAKVSSIEDESATADKE